MKRWYVLAAALAVMGLAASAASAQGQQRQRQPGGFGGGFGANPLSYAADQKSVQEELKMTEDQIKKAKDLQEKSRGNRQDFQGLSREEIQKKMAERRAENDKALAGILSADQMKRLNQIVLQQRGGDALNDPKIQDELKLTDDQKEKIKAIGEDFRKTMAEMRQNNQGGGGDFQAAMQKMQEMRKANNDKLMKLLTADQGKTWKELTGAPFTGKIEPPQFGRPGGGAGGAGTGAGAGGAGGTTNKTDK
jgi:acyl-CoA reductase-like NAD-dependent aldehyde dehydrogenase